SRGARRRRRGARRGARRRREPRSPGRRGGWSSGRGGDRRGCGAGPRRGPWYGRSDSGGRGQGSLHVVGSRTGGRRGSQDSGLLLLWRRALFSATTEPLLRALSLLDV